MNTNELKLITADYIALDVGLHVAVLHLMYLSKNCMFVVRYLCYIDFHTILIAVMQVQNIKLSFLFIYWIDYLNLLMNRMVNITCCY